MEFEQVAEKKSQPTQVDDHNHPAPKPKQNPKQQQEEEIEARLLKPEFDAGEGVWYGWLSAGKVKGVDVGRRGHIKGLPTSQFTVTLAEDHQCYVRFDKIVRQEDVTGQNRYLIHRK